VTATPLCVSCRRRPIEDAWRPFCSERCKLEDLAGWLDGVYRVPGDRASSSDAVPNPDQEAETEEE